MSELKGTLLGIVLALILFGSISLCLKDVAARLETGIEQKVTETTGVE